MSALPESLIERLPAARAPAAARGRRLRNWHGVIGVASALSLFVLVGTGIALNHTQELGLGDTDVSHPAVTAWYGLHPSVPETGFKIDGTWFVAGGGRWRLGGILLGDRHPAPVGVVAFGGWRCIAAADALYILQPDGRLIDRIGRDGLPAVPIQAIGVTEDALIVRGPNATYASTDALEWKLYPKSNVAWSRAEPLPPEVRAQAAASFAPTVPAERLVRDIHSGRILGRLGPYVVDAVACLLSVLSATGAWMYLRSARRRVVGRPAPSRTAHLRRGSRSPRR
jgi:PepSY-associated TM region